MGFRVQKSSEIVLEFPEDDEVLSALHGATVRCRSMSIAEAEAVDESIPERGLPNVLCDDVIVSWDLVDERGQAVPVSVEGMGTQPPWVPQAVYRAWVRGLMSPPKALRIASVDGRSQTG